MNNPSARPGRKFSQLWAILSVFALLVGSMIAIAKPAVAEETPPLTVKVTRTDNLGDNVNVGDRLTFRISYTNNTSSPITAFPTETNLDNVMVGAAKNCRWANLPAKTTKNCDFPYHVVTQEDVDAGFTVLSKWKATKDREGNTVIPGGEEIVAAVPSTITVTDPDATEPSSEPSSEPSADPEPTVPPLTVEVTRTDNLGDDVRVGDRLTFKIKYTNNTDSPITAFPKDTNLDNVMVGAAKNCRWANLAPKASAECTFPYHVATADDVAEGFTVFSNWKATTDREGNNIVPGGDNIAASVPDPITVINEPHPPEPDAATIPTEREMGESIDLARNNFLNFACHRIPALTQAPNGDLLAAWDGRPDGCADAPQANSILQRRSTDGGKSWEMPTVVAAGQKAAPKHGYSDPSYVVDRESGNIFMFFVKSYDRGVWDSQAGSDPADRKVLHAAVTKSTDNGATWSEPKVITPSVVNSPQDTARFAASGEGIQIRHGDHKGRLVQQFTIKENGQFRAMSVYSDNGGETWQHGAPIGSGMDENKVVELSDGRLMLNSRASDGTKARKVAYSADGGQTWSDPVVDNELIDPNNNASIIRAFPNATADDPNSKILLFSNAFNKGSRSNGMVHVSFDNGETWPVGKVFKSGAMAYSTLTPLSTEGQYGLLYEGDNHTINFMKIDLQWLGFEADNTYDFCKPVDQPVTSLELLTTDLNDMASKGEGRGNLVDGDTKTHWHTNWNSNVQLPLTFDLQVAGDPVEAEKLVLWPRQDGQVNGRFKELTVWAGPNADNLTKLGDYSLQNTADPLKIALTDPVKHIRVQVRSTYTDSQFASLAEVQLTRQAPPANCKLITVNEGGIVEGANAAGYARTGDTVKVRARNPQGEEQFQGWTKEPADLVLTEEEGGVYALTVGDQNITLTANFEDGASEPTVKPTDPTVKPTEPSEKPSEPTAKPSEPTAKPSEPTEKPTDPTEGPTATPTEEPSDPTAKPTAPTEKPTDPTVTPTEPATPAAGAIFRVAGQNRYLTAAKISELYDSGVDTVYVATGHDYPDALAAAAVAGKQDAPVVLVETDRLTPEVSAALKRLSPNRLVIVGGHGAVSSQVESALKSQKLAKEVTRLHGVNRYETAANLAKRAYPQGANVVYLATGQDFPDALSASAAAAHQGGPVLLVTKNQLPTETAAALKALNPQRLIVVGGTGVVSDQVANQAKATVNSQLDRYAGPNRFATAQKVAENAFAKGAQVAVIADGMQFPDALVSAAFAGSNGGPVLLTEAGVLNSETKAALTKVKPTYVMVSGGPAAVSYDVVTSLAKTTSLDVVYRTPPIR